MDKAVQTQIDNVQKRTGKSLTKLLAIVQKSGLEKHGQIRDMLKTDLGMGHGDANLIAHLHGERLKEGEPAAADPLDGIYSGAKADLRPIHEKLMKGIAEFGDFEIAPKKAYVSLRRRKQFATIGPPANTRVEVGLNMKDVESTDRLVALKAGGMCQYKIDVTSVADVDLELIGWIRQAYDAAE